jgi:hypothetical protein
MHRRGGMQRMVATTSVPKIREEFNEDVVCVPRVIGGHLKRPALPSMSQLRPRG